MGSVCRSLHFHFSYNSPRTKSCKQEAIILKDQAASLTREFPLYSRSYICCLPVSQFHVGLFSSVLIVRLGQLLGDDQLGNVDTVTEQVRDCLLGMLHCTIRVPVNTSVEPAKQQVRYHLFGMLPCAIRVRVNTSVRHKLLCYCGFCPHSVDRVTQQVRDCLLNLLHCTIRVPTNTILVDS